MVLGQKMNTAQTHGFQAQIQENLKDKKTYNKEVNEYYKKHTD